MHVFRALVAASLTLLVACGGAEKQPVAPAVVGSSSPLATGPDATVALAPIAPLVGVADLGPVPVYGDDPQSGNKNARVTIVEFSDLQCPFCAKADVTMSQIAESYDSESVRIVWKNYPLPFHPHARPLAEAAQGVLELGGPGAFWNFVHTAFTNQKDEGEADIISHWADRAGVDGRAVEEGVRSKKWAERVDRDMALGKQIGATGTPAFFINGVYLSGAQPLEKFKTVIDAEIARSNALLKSGVSPERLYATATTDNRKDVKAPSEQDAEDDTAEAKNIYRVPVGQSPVRGDRNALVTIVEFSDFQCPFCKRVEPTLKEVREKYGDKVRFVWKDNPLPFHPHAEPAAELARDARAQKGDAAFWDVHDRLFASQPALEDADFERIAKDAGLDTRRAMAAIKTKKYAAQLDEDQDLSDDFKAGGTPHFFINGRRLVGAQPIAQFSTIIDEEIKKAEALVKSGTQPQSVYDALIANGVGVPELERKSVPLNPTAPARGAANARVVVQEFADFQCPYCKRSEDTMEEILKNYPGRVKIVWRNMPLPFHADADLAAEAALEVRTQKGDAAFFKMQKALFEHQGEEHGLERPALETYAKELGVDVKKLGTALDAHAHKTEIDRDAQDAQSAGIIGTPSFVINGYYVSGAQPYRAFRKVINRVLTEPPPPPAGTFGKQDLKVGTGAAAKTGDTVRVHYTGTLTNGTVFDSSLTRNTPFEFTIGRGGVIKGWDEGLVGMKVGGKRKLTLPPEFAYGSRGAPPTIAPNSTLLFDIELLEIK